MDSGELTMENEKQIHSLNNLGSWFGGRPKWQRLAAKRLLESDELNESTISEFTALCQQEANNEFPNIDYSIPTNTFDMHDSELIRLRSVSEIIGVNRLAPKKPLDFGDRDIAVVYGENGSGKSGYVRLLKHICGTRDSIRGELLTNVFSSNDLVQKANISFLKGQSESKYEWSGESICKDLCSTDIFDASFGRVFLGGEDEVSYEPPILSFFSSLVDICEKVVAKLNARTEALNSTMPSIPEDFLGSPGADWLGKIDTQTSADDIETHCSFTSENKTELQNIQKRVSEQSPADRAKRLREKKEYADDIIKQLRKYFEQLSDENCKRIIKAKEQCRLKKSAASAAAKEVFSGAQLEGIGTDIWKELWDTARKYSEEFAYKGQKFPVIQNTSVCVLCHQPLTEEAKERFQSFESYIKGETQKQALQAERELSEATDALPDILSVETFKTTIYAAGIEEAEIITGITETINKLRSRKEKLLSSESESELDRIDQAPPCLEKVRNISQEFEKKAKQYLQDAEKDNREILEKELKKLQMKKWLTENKIAIQKEAERLRGLDKIEKAKKLTKTTALSIKKGELAEELITDAFVQRFNNELKTLGASQVKVKLVKSSVSKGKVLHTLQLKGSSHSSLGDVFSEGEQRIISIAAFLADVTGKKNLSPFVFDDPISSLDQKYEEAVVQRLCSIASERQVIIFTHRLSLLGMIQDYAEKVSIDPEIICIREESWGTGEPGGTPLFAKKPVTALNELINARLSKAKKILNNDGKESYETHAKALCSDFRILLERMIEYELMADVVHRYRRAINTKGKIGKLAKISKEDCTFFDDLMTTYSKHEHSHSSEAPVPLPKPNELESDFKKLKQWREEFTKREVN